MVGPTLRSMMAEEQNLIETEDLLTSYYSKGRYVPETESTYIH